MASALDIMSGVAPIIGGIAGPVIDFFTGKNTNKTNAENVANTNQTNLDIANTTNATNKAIADQNYEQQERLFEYQKALQERMFEREDTSYERTAKDMQNAGLNPLSMQGTNGSGEALAMQAPQNNFQAQMPAAMQAAQMQPIQIAQSMITGARNIADSLQGLLTGNKQRDLLQAEKEKIDFDKILGIYDRNVDNYARGMRVDRNGTVTIIDQDKFNNWIKGELDSKRMSSAQYEDFVRELNYRKTSGKHTSDSDVEKALTALEYWLTSGRGEDAWNKIVEKYPILKIFTPQAKAYIESTTEQKDKDLKTRLDQNPKMKEYYRIMHPNLYKRIYSGTTENDTGSSHSSGKF